MKTAGRHECAAGDFMAGRLGDRRMYPLRIERLVYRWPGAERSTLGISALSLASGESLFLYGPSGGGKSTLLSAIAGVVDVPKGAIHVADQDLGAVRGGALG